MTLKLQEIVVVDDDPIICDMMADILASEGYTPTLVRSGREALRLLQGPGRYLVFLDLMMPAFSGQDICTFLAAHPQVRRRHVLVLMSAMGSFAEGTALDVDMHMPKPFLIEDVERVLEKYML